MKGYKTNPTIDRMAQIEITGNVIPTPWYQHMRRENGKPYSIAIELLADIVYWYKPIPIRDEKTGQLIEYRKRFKGDKLQRSYDSFAEMYGYTHEQVKDALRFLEGKKIIDLEFRTVIANGVKYGNVLFIGLNVDKLIEINTPPMDFKVDRGGEESPYPMDFKVDTNTETTTETTQTPAPDGARRTPEKKGDIIDGMIHYGEKQNGRADLGFLEENLRPLAQAFLDIAGKTYTPRKQDVKFWRKTLSEWYMRGFTAEMVRQATRAHLEKRLSLKSPASITYALLELEALPPTPKNLNYTELRLQAEHEGKTP